MVNETPTIRPFALNASATLIDHKLRQAALRGLAIDAIGFARREQIHAA
jgi:hypothetical protein